MLWNFVALTPIFDSSKEARQLKNMVSESTAPLLAFFAETMGGEWLQPRVPVERAVVFQNAMSFEPMTWLWSLATVQSAQEVQEVDRRSISYLYLPLCVHHVGSSGDWLDCHFPLCTHWTSICSMGSSMQPWWVCRAQQTHWPSRT